MLGNQTPSRKTGKSGHIPISSSTNINDAADTPSPQDVPREGTTDSSPIGDITVDSRPVQVVSSFSTNDREYECLLEITLAPCLEFLQVTLLKCLSEKTSYIMKSYRQSTVRQYQSS